MSKRRDQTVPQELTRRDFVRTLVYDTFVLLAAVGLRALSLWMLALVSRLVPGYTSTWALEALEWILDVGLVAGAALLVTFDIIKRLILAFKAVVRALRD